MRNYIYILTGFLFLFACKKDEELYPQIETLEASPTSAVSCLFKGSLLRKGSATIVDFGFVYGNYSDISIQSGTKVSLGNNVSGVAFEKEVFGLPARNMYVRAYLTNEKGTVYGSILHVTLPTIQVQSVAPVTGKAGERIVITGKNFSSDVNSLEVKFNNVSAKIVEATADKLIVEIPSGINTYSYYNNEVPVYIVVGAEMITAYSNFVIIPKLNDFSPKSGSFGTMIIISGDNLPSSSYNISVSFGGEAAYISQITSSGITIAVPPGVTTEKLKVSVTAGSQTTELPGEFTILAPTISSISPGSGLPGSAVTISGANFNSPNAYNYNMVKFGDIESAVTEASSNSITATVPSNLSKGTYKISVSTGVHTVTSVDDFTVTSPSLASFFPISGTVGTEVTIYGAFNPSYYSNNTVTFGTTYAYINEITATTIKTIVPNGISVGKMKITVTSAGQTVTSVDDFTVPALTISNFSPASGTPGTQVIITGTGFNASASNNVVKFGTVETTIVKASPTSITAVVPSNVNVGEMKITVIANGQTISSFQNFTIKN